MKYYQHLNEMIPVRMNFSFLLHTLDMYQALQYIYSHLFVDYVVKNPLFKYNPDEPFNCPLFTTKLEEYLRAPNLVSR